MTNSTNKPLSERDYQQVLRASLNDADKSLTTGGFITAFVGHEILITDTAAPDLDGAAAGTDYSFIDNGRLLYTLRLYFSDFGKSAMYRVKRVA